MNDDMSYLFYYMFYCVARRKLTVQFRLTLYVPLRVSIHILFIAACVEIPA